MDQKSLGAGDISPLACINACAYAGQRRERDKQDIQNEMGTQLPRRLRILSKELGVIVTDAVRRTDVSQRTHIVPEPVVLL